MITSESEELFCYQAFKEHPCEIWFIDQNNTKASDSLWVRNRGRCNCLSRHLPLFHLEKVSCSAFVRVPKDIYITFNVICIVLESMQQKVLVSVIRK